jgi:hypothetical protein
VRVAYASALVQLFIGLSPETAAKLKSLQTNALRKPPPRGRGVFSEKRKQKTPEETGAVRRGADAKQPYTLILYR